MNLVNLLALGIVSMNFKIVLNLVYGESLKSIHLFSTPETSLTDVLNNLAFYAKNGTHYYEDP